jgi:chorismate mutase
VFFQALRGAITIDSNTSQQIISKTKILLGGLIERNHLDYSNIVSIIFTATFDLDAAYPAVAAREIGMTSIPLLCCQEMQVKGSLEHCIRILMHVQHTEPIIPHHVYLEKAACLRPDLIENNIREV